MHIQKSTTEIEYAKKTKVILLADDDEDDCMFFANALHEISGTYKLETVLDGEALMEHLSVNKNLPDIIFLDMNMPCKNGFECLVEIKQIERLKAIPIIIISTSLEGILIKSLHQNGAYFYIRKPNLFAHLKLLISSAIDAIKNGVSDQPGIEDFVITAENIKS